MVTGSLSLGGGGFPHSSSQPQQYDDSKQSSSRYQAEREENKRKSSIEKSSSLFTMPSRKEGRKLSTEIINLPTSMSLVSPNSHHNEPQITPSISNIGGAVLRSKTADFERLLMQNKKSSGSSAASESAAQIQSTDSSTETSATGSTNKRQPIYKRKELISSVQSSKK